MAIRVNGVYNKNKVNYYLCSYDGSADSVAPIRDLLFASPNAYLTGSATLMIDNAPVNAGQIARLNVLDNTASVIEEAEFPEYTAGYFNDAAATEDYNVLINKPAIDSVELKSTTTHEELGLASSAEVDDAIKELGLNLIDDSTFSVLPINSAGATVYTALATNKAPSQRATYSAIHTITDKISNQLLPDLEAKIPKISNSVSQDAASTTMATSPAAVKSYVDAAVAAGPGGGEGGGPIEIPLISTDIKANKDSDVMTASPKAVYTFVTDEIANIDLGTMDYTDLTNKPSIDGNELSKTSTSTDLGLAKLTDIPEMPEISVDINTDATSNDKIPSVKATKDYVDAKVGAGGGGGGTSDYDNLTNKPAIDGNVLTKDSTAEGLNLVNTTGMNKAISNSMLTVGVGGAANVGFNTNPITNRIEFSQEQYDELSEKAKYNNKLYMVAGDDLKYHILYNTVELLQSIGNAPGAPGVSENNKTSSLKWTVTFKNLTTTGNNYGHIIPIIDSKIYAMTALSKYKNIITEDDPAYIVLTAVDTVLSETKLPAITADTSINADYEPKENEILVKVWGKQAYYTDNRHNFLYLPHQMDGTTVWYVTMSSATNPGEVTFECIKFGSNIKDKFSVAFYYIARTPEQVWKAGLSISVTLSTGTFGPFINDNTPTEVKKIFDNDTQKVVGYFNLTSSTPDIDMRWVEYGTFVDIGGPQDPDAILPITQGGTGATDGFNFRNTVDWVTLENRFAIKKGGTVAEFCEALPSNCAIVTYIEASYFSDVGTLAGVLSVAKWSNNSAILKLDSLDAKHMYGTYNDSTFSGWSEQLGIDNAYAKFFRIPTVSQIIETYNNKPSSFYERDLPVGTYINIMGSFIDGNSNKLNYMWMVDDRLPKNGTWFVDCIVVHYEETKNGGGMPYSHMFTIREGGSVIHPGYSAAAKVGYIGVAVRIK